MLYFCSDPSIIVGDAARCMSTESDLLIIVGDAACCRCYGGLVKSVIELCYLYHVQCLFLLLIYSNWLSELLLLV